MRQEVVQKFGLYRIVTTYLVSDWIQVQCANLWTSILMFGGLGMHGKCSSNYHYLRLQRVVSYVYMIC